MTVKLDYEKTTNYVKEALLKDKDKGYFDLPVYNQLDIVVEKMNLCLEEEKKENIVSLLKDNLKNEKSNFIKEVQSAVSMAYYLISSLDLTKSVYFDDESPSVIKRSSTKIKNHIKKWMTILESGKDNGLKALESVIKEANEKVNKFSDVFDTETELKDETIAEIKTAYEIWHKQFNILKYMVKIKTVQYDLKYSDYVKEFKAK